MRPIRRYKSKMATPAKAGHRRRMIRPARRHRIMMTVAVVIGLGAAGTGSWWVWQSGWIQRSVADAKWSVIAGSARLGFSVSEIFVEGRHETERGRLRTALRLKRGAPILAFDPQAARRRVEDLPWVRSASVERHLPDVVHLRIVERRPLALWQRDGNFTLIDTEGKVIPAQLLDRFNRLMVVVGRDAPKHAAVLLTMLASQPALAIRVTAAVRVGGRRWNLHLDDQITVRLPEDGQLAAWNQLAALERSHGLLERDLVAVDLRLPDRVVIRRAPAKADVSEKPERDT